jgi:hypothetical protein
VLVRLSMKEMGHGKPVSRNFSGKFSSPQGWLLISQEVGVSKILSMKEMGHDKPVRKNFSNWLFQCKYPSYNLHVKLPISLSSNWQDA